MDVRDKVAIVTGAGGGIGRAVANEFAERGIRGLGLIDRSEVVRTVADSINEMCGDKIAEPLVGDVNDDEFRRRCYAVVTARYGMPRICVPAAGLTRDRLAVQVNQETGLVDVYPLETFQMVLGVNLLAPIYWGLEMMARIAEQRHAEGLGRWTPAEEIQGVIALIGGVTRDGTPGQVSHAAAKGGLEGAAATLAREAIELGIRAAVIHPGFTDTPLVRALGAAYLEQQILPNTQMRRLIRPEEVADAIFFLVNNSAVSGELWADAGWHPSS